MFRHIAELDAAAADLDYQGKPGGDELRNQYQKAFLLSDAKAAALKSSASTCNRQLADQDSKAQQVIVAARAQDAKNAKPGQTPTLSAAALAQLNLLESQRTDISNACIQALSASLGARTFGDIDFYIRTEVAGRTLVITPPMPTPTAPLSSGSAAGKP